LLPDFERFFPADVVTQRNELEPCPEAVWLAVATGSLIMKRVLIQLAAAALLLSLTAAPAWAQTRIATVDLRKIVENYWKTKQANDVLQERADDLKKERRELADELKKANDDYNQLLEDANDQAVSPEERDKRKAAADDKYKDIKNREDAYQQFEREMQTTLLEQQRRMHNNIINEIRDAVAARGKSAGYGMVIDVSAQTPSETPIVLYNNNENDLTDAVLAQLNAGAPADNAAPAAKPDAKPSDNP
jgi:outer membrane protein